MSELTPELKKIKKIYGERFMKYCREYFPTILEREGELLNILEKSFSRNCRLSEDINTDELKEELKAYIYSKTEIEEKKKKRDITKTPYELLDEAGYNLYECKNEDEIQEFKKYYKEGEELCTFNGGRLNRCVVFWAVKKNVDDIKRENFDNPRREDEYGTSVMGIQFTKGEMSTVSIKNRYNHRVNNPDATYGNNLEKIIPGLTESFEELLKERGLNLNTKNVEEFNIPGYTVASDGKYYKYNLEINGVYYCPGNIIIDGNNIHRLQPEKQELIDYFILDKENKTLKPYDSTIGDCFIDEFGDIEKIETKKVKGENTRTIEITKKQNDIPILIKVNSNNEITKYENKELEEIGDDFLTYNKGLKELNLPKLQKVKDYFLFRNEAIQELDLPELEEVGSDFLTDNKGLKELNIPKLEITGDYFLTGNEKIQELDLPELKEVGSEFLRYNKGLKELNLPKLKEAGSSFLGSNKGLKELNLPKLKKVGNRFLYNNRKLKELNLPKLKEVGYIFLYHNKVAKQLNMPKLEKVGENFLYNNEDLQELNLPELKEVGNQFLANNKKLKEVNMPNLKNNEDLNVILRDLVLKNENSLSSDEKIDSTEIAKVDKDNKITEEEEKNAGIIIENLIEKEQINDNERD